MAADNLPSMINRASASIDSILGNTQDPHQRATLLAQVIRSLLPNCTRFACSLRGREKPVLAIADDQARQKPQDAESLLAELTRHITMEPDPSGCPKEWPRTLVTQEWAWAVEHICFRETWQGMLAACIPDGISHDDQNAIRTLLLVCCLRLEHCLDVESVVCSRVELENELVALNHLADCGEIIVPVVHEIRNYLNSILLHLALIEQTVPEDARLELGEVRRQGGEISALLNYLQDHRASRHSNLDKVDLNHVVRKTAKELRGKVGGAGRDAPARTLGRAGAEVHCFPISLELSSAPLTVTAPSADLRRLCSFLVSNAIAAVEPTSGCVTIRTERASDRAVLCVADTGPVFPADPDRVFEPHHAGRAGTSRLELAACRSLVRRLQGTIRAESGSESGLTITVQLPLSPE